MNNKIQEIARERISTLCYQIEGVQDDAEYCIKKVDEELWGCYSDTAKAIAIRPHSKRELILWLHEGREKLTEMIGYFQQLSDELDDIEDEVNKDEVNNAGE